MTQLSLLSGIDTLAKSCENVPQMDGSPICECGKGTLDCSIHPSTPTEWIASMQDSLAKTLALLAIKPDWEKELEAASTGKSCGLLASLSPDKSLWKTCQQSLVTDSEPYSQTWPRWGMTAGGFAYAHPMSERRITGIGGGAYVPDGVNFHHTPTTSQDGGSNSRKAMWPTPTAHNAKETNAPSEANRNTPTLAAQVGGTLNPTWVEWLMGFPIAWTVSRDWVTRKSRSKPQQPGESLEAPE